MFYNVKIYLVIFFISKNGNCECGNRWNMLWSHFDPDVIITELQEVWSQRIKLLEISLTRYSNEENVISFEIIIF